MLPVGGLSFFFHSNIVQGTSRLHTTGKCANVQSSLRHCRFYRSSFVRGIVSIYNYVYYAEKYSVLISFLTEMFFLYFDNPFFTQAGHLFFVCYRRMHLKFSQFSVRLFINLQDSIPLLTSCPLLFTLIYYYLRVLKK